MTQLLPPKKEVALALLEKSNVDIYLDPRAKGVVVPPHFRKEPRLILKIGLNMPVPIPDLRLDDESMSCTLSFNRVPFYCVVPWPTVFAMVGEDGRGMVWPDDVPQELAVRVAEERRPVPEGRESQPASSPSSARGRGRRAAADVEKPKKSKKKKDEARPALVAVPAPAPSEPKPESRRSSKDGVSPVRRAPDAGASGGGGAGAGGKPARPEGRPVAPLPRPDRQPSQPSRPKRELPPYLRVVK